MGSWATASGRVPTCGSWPLLVKWVHRCRRGPRCRGVLRAGYPCTLASWGKQEAAVEEIEVRPAKHLAFQHLEAVDMALDRAV